MILVDGNSLGFAATAAHDLHAGTVQTGGVWGFLGYLRDIRETFGGKIAAELDVGPCRRGAGKRQHGGRRSPTHDAPRAAR